MAGQKTFLKLGQLLRRGTLWVKNFAKIALSSTVFEIQEFLCFAFLKKNSKIQNVKFLLKLGKASLHRYLLVKNLAGIPLLNFYFMKKMVSKSTHISVLFYMCTL